MVAYSFKAMFAPMIVARWKRQTVRANRKRHARPGEALQLYVGLRTRQCRKILQPDPICTAVTPIEIAVSAIIGIANIEIDGRLLTADEIEEFAIADGFAPEHFDDGSASPARDAMGEFWLANYGAVNFAGVVIKWRVS